MYILYQLNTKTPDKFCIFIRFSSLKNFTVPHVRDASNLKIEKQKNILNLYSAFWNLIDIIQHKTPNMGKKPQKRDFKQTYYNKNYQLSTQNIFCVENW